MLDTVEIKIPISQALAKEAESAGLLAPQMMESLLRSQINKIRVDRLFEASQRIIQQHTPTLTEEEIEAEILAVRSKK